MRVSVCCLAILLRVGPSSSALGSSEREVRIYRFIAVTESGKLGTTFVLLEKHGGSVKAVLFKRPVRGASYIFLTRELCALVFVHRSRRSLNWRLKVTVVGQVH